MSTGAQKNPAATPSDPRVTPIPREPKIRHVTPRRPWWSAPEQVPLVVALVALVVAAFLWAGTALAVAEPLWFTRMSTTEVRCP